MIIQSAPRPLVPGCYGLVNMRHHPSTPKYWFAIWPDRKYSIDFMVDGSMCIAMQLETEDKPFTLGLDGVEPFLFPPELPTTVAGWRDYRDEYWHGVKS